MSAPQLTSHSSLKLANDGARWAAARSGSRLDCVISSRQPAICKEGAHEARKKCRGRRRVIQAPGPAAGRLNFSYSLRTFFYCYFALNCSPNVSSYMFRDGLGAFLLRLAFLCIYIILGILSSIGILPLFIFFVAAGLIDIHPSHLFSMETAVLRPAKVLGGGMVSGHKKRYSHRKVSGLHSQQAAANGRVAAGHQFDDGAKPETPTRVTKLDVKRPAIEYVKLASTLPLGQLVALEDISGPTYVTAQLLVQQIAFKLSDKVFTYSPETFDLDVSARSWAAERKSNIHGQTTTVVPLQTRTGAGTFALGYIFSPDFDLKKRHVPQALIASTGSLRHLRPALDQLSLLYNVASPFVAHVAAADWTVHHGLVAEYEGALQIADELGLGLLASSSAYEAQHMSLLATLIASILPTVHIYDGVRLSRETLRVIDTLNEAGVAETYNNVNKKLADLNKRLDNAGKVVEIVKAFNDELGTSYKPFEYYGHEAADTVFVVFGSVEAQLAKQVISKLADSGKKVGAVNVRIYRPFVEEAFLDALPSSVQQLAVLGQVHEEILVEDATVQSALYSDVLTAVSFSSKWSQEPTIHDLKYAASEIFTPTSFTTKVNSVIAKDGAVEPSLTLLASGVSQFTFWDLDDSAAVFAPAVVASVLGREAASNVYFSEAHDNLVQGGIIKADIRVSEKCIDAPYAVEGADIVVVGNEKLIKTVAVLDGLKTGGEVIVRLPNCKQEDVEKRLDAAFRRLIVQKSARLHVLDTSFSPTLQKDARLLLELAFLKVARPEISAADLAATIWVPKDQPPVNEFVNALDECLKRIEVQPAWAEVGEESKAVAPLRTLRQNAFAQYDKVEEEHVPQVDSWQSVAKGLAFKELYGTSSDLRPDMTVKTWTVHVSENRRLTPLSYERNIFHIEFDLGDSGLQYNIGEALGIHADNDPEQVREFIKFYGLNADDLVQVPSRENPLILETRTIFQSLVQNLDILGKPPKRFYESLAEFATNEFEKRKLSNLGGKDGADEFKQRSEVGTVTYVDILQEFTSAHPSFADLVRIISPLKRREYSIASAQAVTPNSVALMIVVVDWVDPKGRKRYGQASRYLSLLPIGTAVTVSVKPSVMKLPPRDDAPLIMAGLGTGLAPFRAFVQYRAMQKAQGKKIGAILLYLGSRHQREEYLYGEEWEAYLDAGVVTLLGAAFSRDQPQKIYIQDRMRQTMDDIVKAYLEDEGSFYLCGPTWPVPDVTEVLMEAIGVEAKRGDKKVDSRKEIERLKETGRYVLEVY
jgi:sulfite reductase (NADPH) flavoprotein alpha-component